MPQLTIGRHTVDTQDLEDIASAIVSAFKGTISQRAAIGEAQMVAVAIAEGRTSGVVRGSMFTIGINRGQTPTRDWQYL